MDTLSCALQTDGFVKALQDLLSPVSTPSNPAGQLTAEGKPPTSTLSSCVPDLGSCSANALLLLLLCVCVAFIALQSMSSIPLSEIKYKPQKMHKISLKKIQLTELTGPAVHAGPHGATCVAGTILSF